MHGTINWTIKILILWLRFKVDAFILHYLKYMLMLTSHKHMLNTLILNYYYKMNTINLI
jgi:hypothetical protein